MIAYTCDHDMRSVIRVRRRDISRLDGFGRLSSTDGLDDQRDEITGAEDDSVLNRIVRICQNDRRGGEEGLSSPKSATDESSESRVSG